MRYRHGSCYFFVKPHLSCAIALFCISHAIPGKHQAAVRLHGLAWSTCSPSMLLLQRIVTCSQKAAAVTDSSSAVWLGAEQASGTDTAPIQGIHAWIMSFHFQREVAWQHTLDLFWQGTSPSALPGNLSRSGALVPFQMWQGCVNK